MRVLITRSQKNSQTLAEKINRQQGILIPFPVIECYPTQKIAAFQSAIRNLNSTKIAIFISQPAVHFTLPAIQNYWKTLPNIQWAAIGPATEKALNEYGIQEVITAPHPPYESESLLATPALQTPNIADKKIIIFKGNGGRELLTQTLAKRGGIVDNVESYERLFPNINLVDELVFYNTPPIDALIITSLECFKPFLNKSGEALNPKLDWLKEIPIIVVGLRMHNFANKLHFKRVRMAVGVDDASIMNVLMKQEGF